MPKFIDLFSLYKIQTKTEPFSQRFVPKRAQRHYFANWSSRDLILKARQLGFSTLIQLDHLNTALTVPDIKCATIANTVPNAEELFTKIDYAYRNLPEPLKQTIGTETDNVRKLTFKHNNSSIVVSNSARSGTVQRLHISELAHMSTHLREEVFTGSLQAVAKNGYAVIESTANGLDELYDLWNGAVSGENEWKPHFYGWFWDDDYTATPPESNDWKKDYLTLAKQYNLIADIQKVLQLTDSQFYWYYLKTRSIKAKVKQEYPSTAEEAFLTTGSGVFNLYALQQLANKVRDPIDVMYDGALLIWSYPEAGRDYVIGCDTSEGDPTSDPACLIVLDVASGEQVAELHGRYKDYVLAQKADKVGRFYNNALIAVERNNHGHSVISSLFRTLGYPNLYVHEKKYGGDDKIGWPTNAKTKPDMFTGANGLVNAIDNELITINSLGFFNEARIFMYLNGVSKSGMGAAKNKHDDRVMAMAIAWAVRPRGALPRDEHGNRLFLG